MPTNLSSRLITILAVLVAALWMIFPSAPKVLLAPFKSDVEWSFWPDLKPGIDMVGGTSLIYEIKVPEGGGRSDLTESVKTALKKRVDPDSVRGLVWIPQGGTRLEIQMPMTSRGKEARAMRDKFAAAQTALENINVRSGEVFFAIEKLKGDERTAKLKQLQLDSATRATVLEKMASLWDQKQKAREEQNAAEEARVQIEYERQVELLNDTNFSVADFQRILDQPNAEKREQAVAEIKKRHADFPARLKAMEAFEQEYAAYSKVKDAIDDATELKRLLRGSGVIEFHIVANDLPAAQYQEMIERLQRRGPRTQAGDEVRWYEVERSQEVIEMVEGQVQDLLQARGDKEKNDVILRAAQGNDHVLELFQAFVSTDDPIRRTAIQKQIENSHLIGQDLQDYAGKKWALCYTRPEKSMVERAGEPKWALEQARPEYENGIARVGFQFDPQGAKLFGDLTGNNINKPLAIVLDDRLISAPNIQSRIGGSGVITGGGRAGFSQSELTYLVNTLNAGALPAQLTEEPISERTVGPQLGADNLRRGLYSCYFGLFVVAVFLIGYYYLSGVVAMIAVLMNMVLILGGMAALNAAFTLPGIAGIVLTIGMAVDANVLIFERLREEQLRGLSLRMALRNAFDRAWYAIFDANVTTAITAAALYLFGSEEVRGFGLTLLLGILSSMFTALYVTKTIFATMVDRMGIQKLSSLPLTFPKWDQMLKPNIDWMGLSWIFYAFSTVFVVIGLTLFGIKWAQGQMLDIEFASGTSVQFELKEKTNIEDVRAMVEQARKAYPDSLPSPSVVAVGEDGVTYEVVTPNETAAQVKEAVLASMKGKLNLTVESRYEGVDKSISDVIGQQVVPLQASTTDIAGQAPESIRRHIGGLAVILRNVDPPLSTEEIKKRIEHQRLQPQVGAGSAKRYSHVDVEPMPGGAIVLASDPDLIYDGSDSIKLQQWTDELAGPTWNLVRDAISKPADLQKVTNFNPQIAGETQSQALIAMFLSIVLIMAYIWVRFGNLKYGTATVVALLHDTLFTLAAVGISHYIAGTFFGEALLIEPFRINLNLVAAILTVMGYSMNDTVVVFDRIRENRGKFGHVDRAVINDSINQTLSRTLLTGGTTILTIFVMYTFGGPGIHGFTFALLVGIVVGTYSSIAIASPILLIGQEKPVTGTPRGPAVGRKQFQGA